MQGQNEVGKSKPAEEVLTNEDAQAQALNNFYKLHYPNRKHPQTISKATNKPRSKSVISVLSTPSPQLPPTQPLNPKNSVHHMLASKQVRSRSPLLSSQSPYTESISLKSVLSSKNIIRDLSSTSLPFNSMRDVEEFGKRNANVRVALQRAKDEKIKMNKIVMSHKQTDQVKLAYLRAKKHEIQAMINDEIGAIYQEFFRREYQAYYGDEGEEKFQAKLAQLASALSKRIFPTH